MTVKILNTVFLILALVAWILHMAAPDAVGIAALVMLVCCSCGLAVNVTLALARAIARNNALSSTIWAMVFLVVGSVAVVSIKQLPDVPVETEELSEMLEVYRKDGNVCARNEQGDTLLNLAVKCHQYALIKELASHDAMPAELKQEAAMYAVRFNSKKELDILFDNGLNCNDCVESISLLMQAAMYGQPEMVRYLLAAGADISLRDDNGRTAMHHGVLSEHMEVASLLREAQKAYATAQNVPISEVDVEDFSGRRPAAYASFSEMRRIFEN